MNSIIVNKIRTPDGTELVSRYTHDYVSHLDANGHLYAVDGGNSYLKRVAPENLDSPLHNFIFKDFAKRVQNLGYTELSVTSDEPFSIIRQHYCRGGRGKDGTEPLTYTPICDMSEEWLKACISYNGFNDSFANTMYKAELEYRKHFLPK